MRAKAKKREEKPRESATGQAERLPRIAISMGDPGGIGPEVALKALCDPVVRRACEPLLVGDARFLKNLARMLHLVVEVETQSGHTPQEPRVSATATRHGKVITLRELKIVPRTITVRNAERVSRLAPLGKASKAGGKAAGGAIVEAVRLAVAGRVDGMVTAPVSKESLALAGYGMVGHTELIARLTGARRYGMMMTNQDLRVVFATAHLPLKAVPGAITTAGLVEKFTLARDYLRLYMGLDPTVVGVCCLNPHSGEGGRLGREERAVIGPAIDLARKQGISVEGPYPADSIFQRALARGFDASVAMYHDQGMIPVKIGDHRKVVNITIGIPIVRTSPGHGTAFDIAGEGCASEKSMVNAILECVRIVGRVGLRGR